MFRYYLRCRSCRSRQSLRSTYDGKRDLYFARAEKQLKKQLDIVTLLHSMQSADQIQAVVLDKNARQLLQFQRQRVVTATSSNAGSEEWNVNKQMHDIFREERVADRADFGKRFRLLL